MNQPAYVIDVARFDTLMRRSGYASKSDFQRATGIPRRTLAAVLDHEANMTSRTIRYFLDAFPESTFEYLFYAPDRPRIIERIAS